MKTDLICSFVWVWLLFKVVQTMKGMRTIIKTIKIYVYAKSMMLLWYLILVCKTIRSCKG